MFNRKENSDIQCDTDSSHYAMPTTNPRCNEWSNQLWIYLASDIFIVVFRLKEKRERRTILTTSVFPSTGHRNITGTILNMVRWNYVTRWQHESRVSLLDFCWNAHVFGVFFTTIKTLLNVTDDTQILRNAQQMLTYTHITRIGMVRQFHSVARWKAAHSWLMGMLDEGNYILKCHDYGQQSDGPVRVKRKRSRVNSIM